MNIVSSEVRVCSNAEPRSPPSPTRRVAIFYAYFSEAAGCKVNAIKRTCIGKLGRMLVVHLQRFEYDWNAGHRNKLNELETACR